MHSSPFNMRQFNLSVMKPPVSKSAAGSSTSKTSMSYTNAAKSLDLLRQNIQRNINQEIQSVISRYIDVFFKPGIENIRNNLGPDSVTEDHITNMCRQILEEAKRMYPVYPLPSASPSSSSGNNSSAIDPVESETSFPSTLQPQGVSQPANASDIVKLPLTSPSFGIKRESDTDSEASCMSNASKKAKKSGNKANNGNSSASGSASGDPQTGTTNSNNNSNNSNTSPSKPKKPSGPFRKHVAQWDSNKLTEDTMFIMGAKANKALGFAQTRGRLYVKHPGLFKYASDADDKEWLSKNKLMPATGGRAYIMLLDDIQKLAEDNTLNVTINYDDIKGFKVPEFILQKMKSYINTWKKTYAEEDEKNAALNRSRTSKQQANNTPAPPMPPLPTPVTTAPNSQGVNVNVVNHINNNVISTSLASINPPPPPSLSVHSQSQLQQQHSNHVAQPPSLNNYIGVTSAGNVIYDTSFSTTQPHDMPDFMHIEKPPPMYPGQPQQQQHQLQITNPGGGTYVHSNQLDQIEQAISKGDWSSVSDRSLLQYALQSTRSIGSWDSFDPQDSFDLIESVTNGGLGSGSGMVGENSPLLQISPNAGTHLTAPPLGPVSVSPNCELSAVLDQVSAFQYTET